MALTRCLIDLLINTTIEFDDSLINNDLENKYDIHVYIYTIAIDNSHQHLPQLPWKHVIHVTYIPSTLITVINLFHNCLRNIPSTCIYIPSNLETCHPNIHIYHRVNLTVFKNSSEPYIVKLRMTAIKLKKIIANSIIIC